MTNVEKNFAAADASHRVASQALRVATKKYRAREIGDAEYLAARKDHLEALEIYDTAHLAVLESA
jgi:hypothetical protein